MLQNISYYRLSGYWYPLIDSPKNSHVFKAGSTFGMAFNMYCFINPSHRFKDKFLDLFVKYQNIDPAAMGFPPTWMEEPLWQ
ncbi:Abi family protein [Sphingobacterium prati]|uniref:Abi family protein n=1 Tax=Sphingobacterium prati TaxID=2737006 RepID=UPI001C130935